MSDYKTTIMPKIPQNLRIKSRNPNEDNPFAIKEDQYYTKFKNSNNLVLDNEKKPGSSIDRKKPKYIFPKITPSKAPPSTANSVTIMNYPLQMYKINNNINEINSKKKILEETDKEDNNTQNMNKININYNLNTNNINLIKSQQPIKNNNEIIEEKKMINNKTFVDINKYKDISINFLINNSELSQMFEKLYKNDYNAKKKWVDLNLFGREVFKIRLETYIKNKKDIPSFIKNEIHKLLSNQYCDYVFAQSYKEIEEQCDEHLKDIENFYN